MPCALVNREDSCYGRRGDAFTLIELLAVIGIVGVLLAIALGTQASAKRQTLTAQARTELAVIAEVLETYRVELGTYPAVTSPAELYRTLSGRSGGSGDATPGRDFARNVPLTLADPVHPDDPSNRWVDPWGRDYHYVAYTRTRGSLPPRRGFVLYSVGARSSGENLPAEREVVPYVSGDRGGVVAYSPNLAANLYLIR